MIKHEGSLVDIGKLMQQLERSEKARSDTEDKLRELQKELGKSLQKFDSIGKLIYIIFHFKYFL